MLDQNLLNYIKNQKESRVTKEQITSALLNNGWKKETVEEAFSYLEGKFSKTAAVPLQSYNQTNQSNIRIENPTQVFLDQETTINQRQMME